MITYSDYNSPLFRLAFVISHERMPVLTVRKQANEVQQLAHEVDNRAHATDQIIVMTSTARRSVLGPSDVGL